MRKIKTFLVDDEIGALTALKTILEKDSPELEIVGYASNVEDAFQQISFLRPELVFLDIQLIDSTGFDLLNKQFSFEFEVIFVTAYDQYAIKAFENNALSYLLKPVSFSAIENVMQRVLKVLRNESTVTTNLQVRSLFRDKVAIPQSQGVEYLEQKKIIYLKADGSYCEIHLTDKKKKTVSRPLRFVESRLKTDSFIRVHRSFLVNIDFIKEWKKSDGGIVILTDGSQIPISKTGRKLLMEIIG